MECRPGSFPTPTQLLLSIFSTVLGSPILPVHSLESAVSTIPCRVRPPNCKKFPYDGQEQEQLVNIGPPPHPELRLHNSSLRTSGQQKNRYALRTSILRMFLDHPVKPPNPTEMMCNRGIRVENCLCSIRRSIEGLIRSGKDWALMLLPCLILSPEVFDEDWIRRLPNQDHRCPLCVQCVGFRIQS